MSVLGLNMLVGLENAGDDGDLYEELLQIYCEDGATMLQELKTGVQHTDLRLFITNVHGMKSSSLNIGAMELGEKFKELEFAGKDGNMDLIEEKLPICLKEFEEFLENLSIYLESDDINIGDGEPDVLFLKKMQTALEDMDTDTLDALLERAQTAGYNSVVREQLTRLQTAYDDFDFELAGDILTEMMQ